MKQHILAVMDTDDHSFRTDMTKKEQDRLFDKINEFSSEYEEETKLKEESLLFSMILDKKLCGYFLDLVDEREKPGQKEFKRLFKLLPLRKSHINDLK